MMSHLELNPNHLRHVYAVVALAFAVTYQHFFLTSILALTYLIDVALRRRSKEAKGGPDDQFDDRTRVDDSPYGWNISPETTHSFDDASVEGIPIHNVDILRATAVNEGEMTIQGDGQGEWIKALQSMHTTEYADASTGLDEADPTPAQGLRLKLDSSDQGES